jgi:hypothetical protein
MRYGALKGRQAVPTMFIVWRKAMYKIEWISGYGDADGTAEVIDDLKGIECGLTYYEMEMISRLKQGETYTFGGPLDEVAITRLQEPT